MKIQKLIEKAQTEILTEAAEENIPVDDKSVKEIAQEITDSVEDATGTDVPKDSEQAEAIKDEAEVVWKAADLIQHPYGTAKPGKIKTVLQRALDSAMRNRASGIDKDYPNVIIYGLAGFGKTSIIEAFCKEHHINLKECDAKNLDIATVSGIPYPKQDTATGEWKQIPIASRYWDDLDNDNVVLFLDELNRATGKIRGSLLTLINEHKLPITTEDPKTGRITTMKKFKNLLFTVVAINPADDIFPDNEPLDPAMISRHPQVVEQGPNIKEFLNHLKSVYTAIDKNIYLDPADKEIYAGQYAIAEKLLLDKSFEFDDADDVRGIFLGTAPGMRNRIGNYLNYRTFLSILLLSNGKKADYLDCVEDSGLQDSKVQMIKNILATYTDKVTTGNNLFAKPVNPKRAAKAAIEVADLLDTFAKGL